MTNDFEMPFGKYKGEMCSDVPTHYLDWLLGLEWLKPDLEEKIIRVLEDRPEWTRGDLGDE